MKAADLVLRLQQLPPDTEVLAFDLDTGRPKPVTSYVVTGRKVVLCTDLLQLTRPVVCGPSGQIPPPPPPPPPPRSVKGHHA